MRNSCNKTKCCYSFTVQKFHYKKKKIQKCVKSSSNKFITFTSKKVICNDKKQKFSVRVKMSYLFYFVLSYTIYGSTFLQIAGTWRKGYLSYMREIFFSRKITLHSREQGASIMSQFKVVNSCLLFCESSYRSLRHNINHQFQFTSRIRFFIMYFSVQEKMRRSLDFDKNIYYKISNVNFGKKNFIIFIFLIQFYVSSYFSCFSTGFLSLEFDSRCTWKMIKVYKNALYRYLRSYHVRPRILFIESFILRHFQLKRPLKNLEISVLN